MRRPPNSSFNSVLFISQNINGKSLLRVLHFFFRANVCLISCLFLQCEKEKIRLMEKSLQQADAKRPPPKPASDVTTNTQTPPTDSGYGKDVKGTGLT